MFLKVIICFIKEFIEVMGRTIIVPMLMVDLNDLMTDVVKIVKFAR